MGRWLPKLVWVLAGVCAAARPLGAAMVARLPLEEITHRAASVVQGTVTQVRVGRDESGLPGTWITLEVSRVLKGSAPNRLTIKQYGVASALTDGTVAGIDALPRYTAGEEVVLFLHANSQRGFTSPVGFGQGFYRIDRSSGRPMVRSKVPGDAPRSLDALLSDVARSAGPP